MSRISSIAQGPYGVETAIEAANGHGPYQKKMLTILSGVFWVASCFVMGMGFYLAPPTLICADGHTCNESQACGHWYRKSENSVHGMAYEWDLICEKQYISTVIGVVYFIGTILGSSPMSWLCNKVGRKQCTVISLITTFVILGLASFAPAPEYIYPISFVSGFTMAGFGIGTFLLLDEMVDTDHRNMYTGLLFSFWSVGTCSTALLFWLLNDWRYVLRIFSIMSALLIPFVCTLYESVRWVVVTKKDLPAANLILQHIAKYNHIVEWRKVAIHHEAEEPAEEGASSSEGDEKLLQQMDAEANFLDLFKYHKTRVRVVACAVLYFTNNLCYYGIVFALSSYLGNIYVNGAVLGLGEIVPSIVTGAILNHLPRKWGSFVTGLVGAVFTAGAYMCTHWPCEHNGSCSVVDVATAILLFLSMYTFASSFMMLAIYITELFPTRYRSLALGVCNTCAKVGGLLSSTLMVVRLYGGIHPLLVIASGSFLGTFAVLVLPETKGKDLEDY